MSTPQNDDFDFIAREADRRRKRMIATGVAAVLIIATMVLLVGRFLKDAAPIAEIAEAEIVAPAEPEAYVVAAVPPPPRTNLRVTSTPPGAAVIVNGVATRLMTPADVSVVDGATNTVEVHRTGHRSVIRQVEGGQESSIAVELQPIPTPEPQRGADGELLPPPRGVIRVVSSSPGGPLPGADILVNGSPWPEPTPTNIEVEPRVPYHISVRMSGHRDAVTTVQAIAMRNPEDMREVILEMPVDRPDAAFMALKLRVAPPETEVFLNDEDVTGQRVLNLPANGHYVLRAEAPGYDPWLRAFDATVGVIDVSVILERPRFDPGRLSVDTGIDDAAIFVIPQREGRNQGREIGRGRVEGESLESGAYTLRVAHGPRNERVRGDVDISIPTGQHLHVRVGFRDGELVILNERTTAR